MPSHPQLKLMTDILKIKGVSVTNYQLIEEVGIVLYVEKIEKQAICPSCGRKGDKLHQNNCLTVRDLSVGEQAVYLKVNRRQMRCEHCGKKFTEELEYVNKKRTYTERFRKKIIEEVLNSDIKSVGKRNGVSEQEIETMLKDIGEELIEKKPQNLKKLGIDEIAVVKGQKNYYVVLVDIEKSVIVGIIEKRTEEEVRKYLEVWEEGVLGQIEEVSMDLWKPYKKVAEELMPQAEIVADRFHVMKQVNEELNQGIKQVRREVKDLKNKAERERISKGLKRSKYAILKNEEELTEEQREKLEAVKKVSPCLGEKHQLKERFRNIFEKSQDWAEGLLQLGDWLRDAATQFPESCGTIRRWLGEIIAYFDNRTTQGVVEGINNKLKLIKRRAYGFRNFENFKLRSFLTWHFVS
jgi:transposase